MLLYKYCNPEGINLLKNCNLKVTSPDKFNDPFEFLADVSYPNEQTLLTIHDTRLSLKHTLSQFYGVTSLSYNRDNITMWSHYANGHKGIAIGLETDEIGSTEKGNKVEVFKVKYTQKRVSVYFDTNMKPIFNDNMTDLLLTKSNIWSHEDEYRLLFKSKLLNVEKDGYSYQQINPFGIKVVILGAEVENKLIDDVIKVLSVEEFKHVKLFHSHLDYHEFKLMMLDYSEKLEKFRENEPGH